MATTRTVSKANGYLDDIHISEKEKREEWYLKDNIDFLISNLVHEKKQIKTYRNYYDGVRDASEFEYLTKNFGLGTPSKLNFTPLIKPRVDALVGSMVEENFSFKVSCTDDKTIDLALEQKKASRAEKLGSAIKTFIDTNLKAASDPSGGQPQKGMQTGELIRTVENIEGMHGNNFLSSYEIAAQDIINYFEDDVAMDMAQKIKQLILDLVVTGECYYRVFCDRVGADPVLEIIKAENFFYNKNTNSQYVDTADGVVRREFMTRKTILRKYGKFMSAEQKEDLFGESMQIRAGIDISSGRDLDYAHRPGDSINNQMSYNHFDTLEVFHCEWLAMNDVPLDPEDQEDETQADGYSSKVKKTGYRCDRYEGVRIGSVYLNCGKSRFISRSETRPTECSFTYGGVVYNDRNGKPFSVVGALKDLQDVYDLTLFHRDNLLANSGVPGSRVNIAGIPKQLGSNFMDRLMKFIAMKKNGFELIDPTEPGAQLFQHYGEYDNSVNGQSLAAIDGVLATMERQADLTAATNKAMLGQIAERDAVDNVKQGIKQSLLINADLFNLIRTNHKRMLTDMLNISKVCYSKGKKGSYIMGSERIIFDVLPEHINTSDFAINISYSSKDEAKLGELKTVAKELISMNMLDPDTVIHVMLSDSVTEVKQIIDKAWGIKKQETSQASQATQEVEQLQQQVQQLTNELSKANQQLDANKGEETKLKKREVDIKEREIDEKSTIEKKKLASTADFQDGQLKIKKELVQLEREQLYIGSQNGSGQSAEPKNNV